MRDVCVLGGGMTPFGVSEETGIEMFTEAALSACRGSRVAPADIQALVVGHVLGDFGEGRIHMAPVLAAEAGLRVDVPGPRAMGIPDGVDPDAATRNLIGQRALVGGGRAVPDPDSGNDAAALRFRPVPEDP